MSYLVTVGEYPLTSTFGGRRAELLELDAWWRSSKRPLCVVGEGGSGKSALVAKWVRSKRDLRVVWYSFYTGGGSIQGFVDACSKLVERATESSTEQYQALAMRLKRERALVVLDGLERCLIAYHRHDAGRGEAESELHAFVDEAALPLVNTLVAAGVPILLTSRVLPPELEGIVDTLDVEQLRLDDALAMFPDAPPTQASLYLAAAGQHALTARMLRAVVSSDSSFRPAGTGNRATDRLAIFEAAWARLSLADRQFLSSLAAFRSGVDVKIVAELLRRDSEEESNTERVTLKRLEGSGWVLYGRGRIVDLHPIVRGFAFDRLTSLAANALIDRVAPRCRGDERRKPQSLADLGPQIDLIHMLCDRERYREAEYLFKDILEALKKFGAARERLLILERFFPNGFAGPHVLSEHGVSFCGTEYSLALEDAGRTDEALQVDAALVTYSLENGAHADDLLVDILNYSCHGDERDTPLWLGCLDLAQQVAHVFGDPGVSIATSRAHFLAVMGREKEFEAFQPEVERRLAVRGLSPEYADHDDVRYAIAQFELANALGRDPSNADAHLRQLAEREEAAAEDEHFLHMCRTEGAVARRESAQTCLKHARKWFRCGRASGTVDDDAAAALAYCEAKAGNAGRAAKLLPSSGARPELPTGLAWRALALAACGTRLDEARSHALEACRRAWGAGPPWADAMSLRLARLAIEELRLPEPHHQSIRTSPKEPLFAEDVRRFAAAWQRKPARERVDQAAKSFLLPPWERGDLEEARNVIDVLQDGWTRWSPNLSRGAALDDVLSDAAIAQVRHLFAGPGDASMLEQIRRSERCRDLESLTIVLSKKDCTSPADLPPTLRQLCVVIYDYDYEEEEEPGRPLVSWPALPKLERLILRASSGAHFEAISSVITRPLVALSLEGPLGPHARGIANTIAKANPKRLVLRHMDQDGVSEEVVSGIERLTNVEELCLESGGELDKALTERLAAALTAHPAVTGVMRGWALALLRADRLRRAAPNVVIG